jgi:hypothetical protein
MGGLSWGFAGNGTGEKGGKACPTPCAADLAINPAMDDLEQQETALPQKPALRPPPCDVRGGIAAMDQPVGVAGLAATAALRYSNLGSGPVLGRRLRAKPLILLDQKFSP